MTLRNGSSGALNGVWRTVLFAIAVPILFAVIGWAWASQDARIAYNEDIATNHKVAITNQETRLQYIERELSELRADIKELLSRVPKR